VRTSRIIPIVIVVAVIVAFSTAFFVARHHSSEPASANIQTSENNLAAVPTPPSPKGIENATASRRSNGKVSAADLPEASAQEAKDWEIAHHRATAEELNAYNYDPTNAVDPRARSDTSNGSDTIDR
jgi:type IV secretory pathway VirB10-like protein